MGRALFKRFKIEKRVFFKKKILFCVNTAGARRVWTATANARKRNYVIIWHSIFLG